MGYPDTLVMEGGGMWKGDRAMGRNTMPFLVFLAGMMVALISGCATSK